MVKFTQNLKTRGFIGLEDDKTDIFSMRFPFA